MNRAQRRQMSKRKLTDVDIQNIKREVTEVTYNRAVKRSVPTFLRFAFYTLIKDFGFGAVRLARFAVGMTRYSELYNNKKLTMDEIEEEIRGKRRGIIE